MKATGYVTVAERTPRAEDFPGAPPETLVPGSVVFSPPEHAVPLTDHLPVVVGGQRRELAPSAGSEELDRGKERFPVVHIAYADALAYASGPASACRPKRNGSLRRAAV